MKLDEMQNTEMKKQTREILTFVVVVFFYSQHT